MEMTTMGNSGRALNPGHILTMNHDHHRYFLSTGGLNMRMEAKTLLRTEAHLAALYPG